MNSPDYTLSYTPYFKHPRSNLKRSVHRNQTFTVLSSTFIVDGIIHISKPRIYDRTTREAVLSKRISIYAR